MFDNCMSFMTENQLFCLFSSLFLLEKYKIIVCYMQANLPKGSGYVEFKTRADAEKAQAYMDGVWFG